MPITATFLSLGFIRDRVKRSPGIGTDGVQDHGFQLQLSAPSTVTSIRLTTANGTWVTQPSTSNWALGVAVGLDSPLLTLPSDVTSLHLFAADGNVGQYLPIGQTVTVQVTLKTGEVVTASTTIRSSPPVAIPGVGERRIAQQRQGREPDGGPAAERTRQQGRRSGDSMLRTAATVRRRTSSGGAVITSAPATKLSITTQGSTAPVNGVAFAQQPVIQLQDVSSASVSEAGRIITVGITTGAGLLSGTLTAVTNTSGVATFTNLKITGTIGARTLLFSSPGLTSVTGSTQTLVAGAATQITAQSTTNQNATVSTNVASPPSVIVRDVSGNAVSGVTVTFTITGGSGSRSPATVNTGADGIATLTSWTLGASAGSNNNTLEAAA